MKYGIGHVVGDEPYFYGLTEEEFERHLQYISSKGKVPVTALNVRPGQGESSLVLIGVKETVE